MTPHVVIIGGGFGGLEVAKALRDAPVQITLVDRRNHHLFQPLLYQVASAGLSPADIAYPIRSILRTQRNATVLWAEVQAFEPERKVVKLVDRELTYDYLVVATGATHSYFSHPEWEPLAPGLKTIEDAVEIRRRVLTAFECAERETDETRRNAWLTFVVIGGGATGVEVAGALAEIAHHALRADFRHVDPQHAKVLLIEGGPRLLPAFSAESGAAALRQLQALGVTVRLQAKVEKLDDEYVYLADERIAAHTKVWAAGVAAPPVLRSLGGPVDRAGRVLVTPELAVPGHREIYVIGDAAAVVCDGKPVPGVAPAAMQMGRYVAQRIVAAARSEAAPAPFEYFDKGSMATVGRSSAVVELGRMRLSGLLAWLAWLFVHIMYLVGFRNRLSVMFQWAWAYVTFQRGARLITGGEPRNARLLVAPADAAQATSDGEKHAS